MAPKRAFLSMLAALAFVVVSALPGAARAAGYAHYWAWRESPTPDAVSACTADMRKILAARRSILSVEAEEAGLETIFFNGVRVDAHEPFVFPGETGASGSGAPSGFNSCRTSWKPYDEVVTACLLVARDHFPDAVLEIASDGSFEDWAAGARLYEHVMKKPARSPFSPPHSETAGAAVAAAADKAPALTKPRATEIPVVSASTPSARAEALSGAQAGTAVSRQQSLLLFFGAALGILILMAVPTRK